MSQIPAATARRLADTPHVLLLDQLPCAGEAVLHRRADVFLAQPFDEAVLVHGQERLRVRTVKQEMFAAMAQVFGEILQCFQTGTFGEFRREFIATYVPTSRVLAQRKGAKPVDETRGEE